jgi:hypothetical protein
MLRSGSCWTEVKRADSFGRRQLCYAFPTNRAEGIEHRPTPSCACLTKPLKTVRHAERTGCGAPD